MKCPLFDKDISDLKEEECPNKGILCKEGQLFVSYSHKDGERHARKLFEELKKTCPVWYDIAVRAGLDWCACVEQAIKVSNMVAVIMSKELCDSDICRKELAFAFLLGKAIIPIKVSSHLPAIPLLLANLSWVDISGDFDKELNRLRDVLIGRSSISEAFAAPPITGYQPLSFGPEIAKHLDGFVGREWIRRELNRRLNERQERLFVIEGEPGIGKSAIAAHLSERSDVVGIHFCDGRQNRTINPFSFVASLTGQFRDRIPGFKEQVEKRRPGYIRDTPYDAFRQLVTEPLLEVPDPGGLRLVVIDALDESLCMNTERNSRSMSVDASERAPTIVDVLAQQAKLLPSWLRFVATTRPEKLIQQQLKKFRPFVLEAGTESNLDDLASYIDDRTDASARLDSLDEEEKGRFKDKLKMLAAGNFLFAASILRDVEDDVLDANALEDGCLIPDDLGSYYSEAFRYRFADLSGYQERYLPILEVLGTSREPMTLKLIEIATGCSGVSIRQDLNALRPYLRVNRCSAGATYTPFHKSLTDWLFDFEEAGDYACDMESGHRRIADALVGCWRDHEYSVMHLPYHMAEAMRYEGLEKLLLDADWLRCKLELTSHWEIVKDYEELTRAVPGDRARVSDFVAKSSRVSPLERLNVLRELGAAYEVLGNRKEAEQVLSEADNLAGGVHDDLLHASVLTRLGIIQYHLGKFKESDWALGQALEIYRQRKSDLLGQDRSAFCECLNWNGIRLRSRRQLTPAMTLHKESRDVAVEIGNRKLEAHAIANIGAVCLWERDYTSVLQYWKEALAISREIDDWPWVAHYGIDVGYILFLNRSYAESIPYLREGIEVAENGHFAENIARGLANLGNVLFVLNKGEEATRTYERALKIAQRESIVKLTWRLQHNIGNVYRKEGKPDIAKDYYDSAIRSVEEMLACYERDEDKMGFLQHHLSPFRSMILLCLDEGDSEVAHKFALRGRDPSLTDYLDRRQQNIDLDEEEEREGNRNYIDGYYVETE